MWFFLCVVRVLEFVFVEFGFEFFVVVVGVFWVCIFLYSCGCCFVFGVV